MAEELELEPGQEPDDEVDEGEEEEPSGKDKKEGDPKIALSKERSKRKALSKQVKELTEQVNKLKPVADEYQQVLYYLPTILAKKEKGKGQTNTEVSEEDQEALELAQDMEFQTEDGKPDVARAKKLLARIDRKAGEKVSRETAGVKRTAAAASASQVRDKAYKAVDKDGRLFAKREFIDQVFDQIPPEQLLNPDNAVAAMLVARGLGGPGEDPTEETDEPIYVEQAGRRGPRTYELSPMEKALAKQKGLTDKQWAELADTDSNDLE